MNYNLSKTELAKLLKEAESAHAKYEKKLGRRDTRWPNWYAEYIIKQLEKSL